MADERLSLLTMPRAQNGGQFVSRGIGTHPRRVIDSHELIFVTGGSLRLEEDGRQFTLSAGETLLLWPGRRHAGIVPYDPDTEFYWVHFDTGGEKAAVS